MIPETIQWVGHIDPHGNPVCIRGGRIIVETESAASDAERFVTCNCSWPCFRIGPIPLGVRVVIDDR